MADTIISVAMSMKILQIGERIHAKTTMVVALVDVEVEAMVMAINVNRETRRRKRVTGETNRDPVQTLRHRNDSKKVSSHHAGPFNLRCNLNSMQFQDEAVTIKTANVIIMSFVVMEIVTVTVIDIHVEIIPTMATKIGITKKALALKRHHENGRN